MDRDKLLKKAEKSIQLDTSIPHCGCWRQVAEKMAAFAEAEVRAERERAINLLERFAKVGREALGIIEREGFVFDHSGGQWEKLAFTFYSNLVGVSEDSKHAIEEINELRGEK